MLTRRGGDLKTDINYHAHRTSYHTSRWPYMLDMWEVSSFHPPLDFDFILLVSSFLGDSAMMLSQLLICGRKLKEVLKLSETKAHGDSKMWLDVFWHFDLALGLILEVNCGIIYSNFYILACCLFILSAFSNLSRSLHTHCITWEQWQERKNGWGAKKTQKEREGIDIGFLTLSNLI